MNRLMCVICVGFLSLLFLIPGGASADKPEFLRVAIIGDYSGPYAPSVGPSRPGCLDAWEYINTELGGVHGVKVKPVIKDMTGKVALGLSMYNELVGMKPKPLFIDTSITTLAEALRVRYVEDDFIGFHAGAICSLYPHANSWAYYALYPEQVGACLDWIKKTWTKKRNIKVGILTWDTSYGRAIMVQPFYDYLKKINEHKVMTEVVDKHGWGGLNAKNIVEAMNQIKDFVPLGGITRITYTATQRTPTVAKIFIVKDGKFIPQTGFFRLAGHETGEV